MKDEAIRVTLALYTHRLMLEHNMNLTTLSRRTGITRGSLYTVLDAGASPRFTTVLEILRAFNKTVDDFFQYYETSKECEPLRVAAPKAVEVSPALMPMEKDDTCTLKDQELSVAQYASI